MKVLVAEEFEVYRKVACQPADAEILETISSHFKGLNRLGHELGEQSLVLVNHEVRALDDWMRKSATKNIQAIQPFATRFHFF